MGSRRRRRKNRKARLSVLEQPIRFHLYSNYSDAMPRMSGHCYEIEQGNNGFWIRWKKDGGLHFEDHVAYAMVEILATK